MKFISVMMFTIFTKNIKFKSSIRRLQLVFALECSTKVFLLMIIYKPQKAFHYDYI